MKKTICLLVLSALPALGVALAAPPAATPPPAAPSSNAATTALHALFAEEWERGLRDNPLFATSVGDNRFNDRLPTMTPAELARQDEQSRATLDRLHAIGTAQLGETDRVSYELFERELVDGITDYRFKTYQQLITAEGGFHTEFSQLAEEVPLATVKDYDNYIARLRAFPAYARENTELLRQGLASGFTLPQVVMTGFTDAIAMHVVDDPAKSIFWKPFETFPPSTAESDRERLRQAGRGAIRDAIVPAYREFLAFMRDQYVPHARATVSAADLPNGRAFYAAQVRHFTTLDVTPEAVHDIGLREVARIHAEMLQVMKSIGTQQDLPQFLEFLRTDPRFYAKTPEELLEHAALIAKRMDGKLPSLFKHLPRQPYGVEPVPADIAPKYTGGRYNGAPIDSRRAGTYWVNTYALDTRPFYNQEALTFHEAVPGHHLQISLQQELRELPAFRRFVYVDAFGEGWGLYSEWLGLEAGFYKDPYSNFGRLSYEMWRACRLVVDTGIHALGWSRQRAIDYLAANTALSHHEVETEVDRYIAWPGQALAYKIGEITIKRLRHEAEQALGERFDVRDFHDAVLHNGTVTMPLLERQVHAYIAATSATAGAGTASPGATGPGATAAQR